MGVLDKFEKGVERAVSDAFARPSGARCKPVEIASALRRELDDRGAVVGRDRTVVPNEFVVELCARTTTSASSTGEEPLADELAANVTSHADQPAVRLRRPGHRRVPRERGRWRPVGSSSAPPRCGAPCAPATTVAASQRHPLVDIDGQRYLLTGPVTVIGRGSEADIILDDPGVSRRHAEIRVTPDAVRRVRTSAPPTEPSWTGTRCPPATLVDGNTVTIGRTRIVFWTGADEDEG